VKHIKISLVVLFIVVGISALFSEGLNVYGRGVKDQIPHVYEVIKIRAIKDWETDHEMVVYEINKQSESYLKIVSTEDIDINIFVSSLLYWADSPESVKADMEHFDIYPIDWEMVLYEYNKQVEAKNSY